MDNDLFSDAIPFGRMPSIEDLALIGKALVSKHDRGCPTEATTKRYAEGLKQLYRLTEAETELLTRLMA